jgi:tetratricopeptide (TPR) repeat protein
MIGRAYCKLGRTDEAVASLEAMIAKQPDNVDLKASYGWFAFRQECRPDAGLTAVLAGIAQDPKSAELRYLEAELRRLVNEPEPALAAIRKASELEPDSAYYKRQVRRFEALAAGG